VATVLMIFLRINCPNVIGLVWRRHTKFHIGMAAPYYLPYRFRRHALPVSYCHTLLYTS